MFTHLLPDLDGSCLPQTETPQEQECLGLAHWVSSAWPWLQTHPHSAPNAPPPSWSHRYQGPHRSHWSPRVGVGKEKGMTKLAPHPSALREKPTSQDLFEAPEGTV